MPRPTKNRKICCFPRNKGLVPKGMQSEQTVVLSFDEYEAIRLIDLEGFSQEECAVHMDIARTTAQAVYLSARKKLAECLVNCAQLEISGGEVRICENRNCGCKKNCCRRVGTGSKATEFSENEKG